MELLQEYNCKAKPARCSVEVMDAEADLYDEDAATAARSQVVAGNGYHLYIHTLQADIDVVVTIRIWDAPPTAPAQAEGSVPVSIESETGTLVIYQLEYGPAGQMALPRPGVYEGHAWWENRQATADYYETTLDYPPDDTFENHLDQAWKNCPVTERYVLDLAYTGEPEPTDDEL
ncbi:hypothetical protein [Streptomyces eurythermus]|uniref:hypothetical protein n=1 Tax=Streptomyces eurythermus TaxID=42237 RepID=UPI00340B8BBE